MLQTYEAFQRYWKEIFLVVSVITIAKIVYEIWLGGRFITRVLSDPPIGWPIAAYKLAEVFLMVPSLFISFSGRRLNAARHIVELEILLPAAPEPDPNHCSKDEFPERLKKWQKKEDDREKVIAGLLKKHFSDNREEFLGWLWRNLKSLLLGQPKLPRAKPPTVVPVDDFPSLDDSRPAIKRYFDVLKSIGEGDRSFLSEVEISAGYLAPLFLVTGLVNRFADEDGWKLILQNYRRLVERDTQYSMELRELRSFLFNCWLLWGPSVSPCSCKTWNAKDCPESLMLQYGYGDENNSIDVLIGKGRGFKFTNGLKSRLAALPDQTDPAKFTPISVYAAPYSVQGRFKWGPCLPDGEISPAQRLIQGGTMGCRKPLSGRIVLECDFRNVTVDDTSLSAKYYSAYIWIMFVIEDGEGNPFFPHQPWKNLLPFFEHGNIADATTFLTLKECLIAKVASALTEILVRPTQPGEAKVSLRYVCGLDDSQCCKSGTVLFPTHPGIPGRGEGAGPKPERLIDILKNAVALTPALVAARDDGRLRVPSESGPSEEDNFSSCDLPAIVEGFYQDLKQQKEGTSVQANG